MARIRNVKDARAMIGKRVYWDENSVRYKFIRSGIVEGAEGRNIIIDGDHKWMRHLDNLRDTE